MTGNSLLRITKFILSTFSQEIEDSVIEGAVDAAVHKILNDWAGGLNDHLINIHAFAESLEEKTNGLVKLRQVAIPVDEPDRIDRRLVIEGKGKRKSAYHPSFLIKDSSRLKPYALINYSGGIFTLTEGEGIYTNITKSEILKKFLVPDYTIPGYTQESILAFSFTWKDGRK